MLNAIVKPGAYTEMDHFIFESWGYMIIPSILNEQEISAALDASKRLHKDQTHKGVSQVGYGFATESSLERLIDHPAIIQKVQGIYGTDHVVVQAAWCTKQPAFGRNGGWHQDGSSAFDFKMLGHPIPLLQLRVSYLLTDQSSPGMGNMEMIPGSHRSRVSLPKAAHNDSSDCSITHVVCAPAGSALIFHNAVWHRTFEHNHDYDRYTMHYVYSPPWMRFADRFTDSKEFLDAMTPIRRGLMGDYSRPDSAYAGGYYTQPIPKE